METKEKAQVFSTWAVWGEVWYQEGPRRNGGASKSEWYQVGLSPVIDKALKTSQMDFLKIVESLK